MRFMSIIWLLACSDKPEGETDTDVVEVDNDGDGVVEADDCDDNDASVFPGADEVCDEIDNDCDGLIDDQDDSIDLSTGSTFYVDGDSDEYGDIEQPLEACVQPEGTVENSEDCNDDNADIYPGANEVCDEIDNDCDELIDDEDDSIDLSTGSVFYVDGDSDGFGGMEEVSACVLPEGAVENMDDCDDGNVDVHPDADEVCDEIDNDCDELIDDEDDSIDVSTQTQHFMDSDGDGFGYDAISEITCFPSSMYVAQGGDCDDGNADIHPNAVDICDGIDNNCDLVLDDPNTVSGITAGVYTDVSYSFQGSPMSVASVTLTEDEYLFCEGTYYVNMEAISDVTLSSLEVTNSLNVTLDGRQTGSILYSSTDFISISVYGLYFYNGTHGIEVEGDSIDLTVDTSLFDSNIDLSGPLTRGGGISHETGLLTVVDSLFYGNEAGYGGAISSRGDIEISGTWFESNIARGSGGRGGGIYFYPINNGTIFDISDSTFSMNESEGSASAMAMFALDSNQVSYSAVMTVDTVTVSTNTSVYSTIGAIGGALILNDSTISNNTNVQAAPVALYSSEAELINTDIFGNSSSDFSAVEVISSSVLCTSGSSIYNNTSGTGFAAIGVLGEDSTFTSVGCDFGGVGSENTPMDVWTDNIESQVFDYTNVQDFECTPDGCPESFCDDGLDDNGDGFSDCADSSCELDPVCLIPEDCTVAGDEDSDGLFDCDDPDCATTSTCNAVDESECQDGIDNDQNGYLDCFDIPCVEYVGTTIQMDQATEDWITPDTSCYDSNFSLQLNDSFIGENTTLDGCVRYYTDTPEVDTVLSLVDTCPSLGGVVLDCNDDIDVANQDYTSQLFVDTTDGGAVAFVLSAYDFSENDYSVTVQSDIPEVCYTLNMTDSYGDGWNGGSVDITQNGATTSYSNTDDNGDGGCNSGACEETTSTTVCLESLSFELAWTSGTYDGEVSFELLAQDGTSVCSEGAYPSIPCGGAIVPTCDQL